MLRLCKHLLKRGQTGQALVIIALGFIGLLGFVGIVTDISVLFIRYSTMSRAVDAAAIAAAGQMRRVSVPVADPLAPGEDEAISVANLNLAARQFIELYGLSPTNVIVETCRAQQIARDVNGNPVDAAGNLLFITTGTPPNTTIIRNPIVDSALIDRYQELCTEDELKLVRVTAQIESPTIFLRLLGYETVTLTEEAISQTAVLDVVLIMDVSVSMLDETTYDDWDRVPDPANPGSFLPQGVAYLPPYVNWADYTLWDNNTNGMIDFAHNGVNGLNAQLRVPTTVIGAVPDPTNVLPADALTLGFGGSYYERLFNDGGSRPGILALERNEITPGVFSYRWYTGPDATNGGRLEPREECRVRAWPGSYFAGMAPVPSWLQTYYNGVLATLPVGSPQNLGAYYGDNNFTGFVPMYNFHGCCNDPDGNFNFGDLICQPFGRARDAAREFLTRLDFLRGDRIGYVAFDRAAMTVDPDGNGPQSFMIETENDLFDAGGVLLRRGATETLDTLIGVRSTTLHYVDADNNGEWDGFVDRGTATTWARYMTTRVAEFYVHPVRNSCELEKSVLSPEFTDADLDPAGVQRTAPVILDIVNYPGWATGVVGGLPNALRNYDYRAGCADSNIGGALAQASNTLYNEGRSEGAVWIMVLLGEGAAGASNVVTRNGEAPTRSDPYAAAVGGPPGSLDPVNIPLDPSGPGSQYSYGSYGLCPFGDAANPSEMLTSLDLPFCLDLDPSTRHFCGDIAAIPDIRALDSYPNCYEFYDVDDYARDWADWIGLAEVPGAAVGAGSGRVSNQLVPTIFTIGFGLSFDYGDCDYNTNGSFDTQAEWDCQRGINPANRSRRSLYLGEQVLRYIADVGDNNQIDDDQAQQQLGDRIANSVAGASPNWGDRGPCEQAAGAQGTFAPLPPGSSCGNYFSAETTGDSLRQVFNEIASRMFTRLSQ